MVSDMVSISEKGAELLTKMGKARVNGNVLSFKTGICNEVQPNPTTFSKKATGQIFKQVNRHRIFESTAK